MVGKLRPRRFVVAALLGTLALGLSACGEYPNSTFNHYTDLNTATDALWDRMMFLGTIIFVLVEAAMVYVIIRYRGRPGDNSKPKQVHGHAGLEVTWTAIPVLIIIYLAIPSVKTAFETQAKASPDALQVEVVAHQWWWEFKYPQLGFTTANELYVPNGRTVNLQLKSADVVHSFWAPQMGGKRDVVSNRTNYIWFTPNADLPSSAWNGFCAEFCGPSHANMRFRVFTVTPDEFTQWAAHQADPAIFTAPPPEPAAGATPIQLASLQQDAAAEPEKAPVWVFPRERLEKDFAYTIPTARIPANLKFDESLLDQGDAERGRQIFSRSTCIGCHTVAGTPFNSPIGPNLTHVGSRYTIAGGLYPNDARHMAYWIKSAPDMKPGSFMPTIGKGLTDPVRKNVINAGGLTDAEIADVVAYLQALK